VGAARQTLSRNGRTLATLWVALVAAPPMLEAQVGLTSGMAQVALEARSAPRGSIQGVSSPRETGRNGSVRETSVTVRLSANTGYQLMVRGTGAGSSRIWVRAVNGEFQELTAGSSVTVARNGHSAGQWDREVQYRIQSADAADINEQALPVRYEIAINPTM
jgi:hypothetical protein